MNGGANQTITFVAGDIIAQINAVLVGGKAYASDDITKFLLRSDNRGPDGSVQIVGGTALADLGLTARIITAKSEDTLVATIAALANPEDMVTYADPDGFVQDWYAITTVDTSANESLKSAYIQPIQATGPLCVIEGIVMNLQGARVPDVEVHANIQLHPEKIDALSNITLDKVRVLTSVDGRFSIALLQGAIVKLECDRIGLSRMIKVPEQAYAFINDIHVDLAYRYPIGSGG